MVFAVLGFQSCFPSLVEDGAEALGHFARDVGALINHDAGYGLPGVGTLDPCFFIVHHEVFVFHDMTHLGQ